MRKFKAWINEVDRWYSQPYHDEKSAERCGAIVSDAGDYAARLGLSELFQFSRKFGLLVDPLDAKAFLSACIGACTKPPASEYLDSVGACSYLGVTGDSLYGLVERGQLIPLRGPRRTYRFTTKMLDEYLCRKSAT